nr:phosphatase PAP2 family protein [Sphingomicrobium aestuariivivum]
MPLLYHQGWFAVLFATLIALALQGRHRALLAYALIWTLVAPLVHLLWPAAGPLFWDELGLGQRFAAIPMTAETAMTEAYLWQGFVDGEFNTAGGISAMPSVHIATSFWLVMVAWESPRWRLPAIAFFLYMWGASVAIGWHYWVDGLAGVGVALIAYALAEGLARLVNGAGRSAG